MGAIKLPIPILHEGKRYGEVETKSIVTSVIADTNKVMQKGDDYRGIQTFVSGGIEKIGEVSDRQTISALVGYMPYKSAWLIAVRLIMQDEKDDGVEGMYPCPRCGEKKVCEFNEDKDLDTRDFISDLKVEYMDGEGGDVIEYNLETPIEIVDEDKNTQEIEKLEMAYPTLNHCSLAFNKAGDKDEIRLQLAVYVEALIRVNGDDIDRKFKNNFGMYIFEHMSKGDIRGLTKMVEKFGLATSVRKICNKCGKEFEANLNTANFFASALR